MNFYLLNHIRGYLYFMEHEEHGVGTWDGDWDVLFKTPKPTLKTLSQHILAATKTAYRGLANAIQEAANEAAPEPGTGKEASKAASGDLVVSPQNIIRRALFTKLISPEEAHSHKMQQAAELAAEDISEGWPEDEGFGTSDMTPVMENMLNMAGIPTEYRGGRLERKV